MKEAETFLNGQLEAQSRPFRAELAELSVKCGKELAAPFRSGESPSLGKEFFKQHWDQKNPLLLGYSGGTDSKALLHALFEAGVKLLHVAHVDHGWREESAQEALELKREVEALGYPFHSTRLTPPSKNREAAAREGRMAFFHSLFQQFPFQALLLAHQAEDLAETALKRILEGAHFSFSGGMQRISKLGDIPIWRPLLFTRKSEILSFLEKKKLKPFLDPTNSDPAYLRSRMREEILPFLNRSFGKETIDNLICLSERSYELKEYLDRKTASIPQLQGPWGTALDLRGVERIEARHLLQKHLAFSRPLLETLLDWIEAEKPNRQLTPQILADRGMVFLLSEKQPRFEERELITLGKHRLGDWVVEVSESKEPPPASGWQQVWSGHFSAVLPVGQSSLKKVIAGSGKKFRTLWNEKKVPAFLREKVPALFQGKEMVGEFLSGQSVRREESFCKISFTFNGIELLKTI